MSAEFKKLEVIIRPGKFESVKDAMEKAGYTGVTVSQVEGHGNQKGLTKGSQGSSYKMELVPKIRMEVIILAKDMEPLVTAITKTAQTGNAGDGKIFISDIGEVIRIRTGERGEHAV